jgi:signal transduction histidine kinase/ligand-binding sensor domain-containing protein
MGPMPVRLQFPLLVRFLCRGRRAAWGVLLVLAGGAFLAGPVRGDDFQAQVWTAETGLPDSSVTAIAQTPDGYLWVGTFNGLVRFDGINFDTFYPENTPALAHARIRSLNVDKRGTLWINTFDGSLTSLRAGRFAREWTCKAPNDRYNNLEVSSSNAVAFLLDRGDHYRKSLAAAPGVGWEQLVFPSHNVSALPYGNGECVVWFKGQGLRMWRLRKDHFQPVTQVSNLDGQVIKSVAPDAAGRLWVGTDRELAVLEGTNAENMAPTNGDSVLNVGMVHPGEDGGVWVMADGRMRKMMGRRWVVEAKAMRDVLGLGLSTSGVLDDHRGGFWLFDTGKGLFHVGTDGSVWRFHGEEGFNSERVTSMMEDREGSLWAGFELGGLVRVRASRFQQIDPGDSALGVVRSVCEDARGTLWVGSLGGGLGRWENSVYTHFTLPGDSPHGSAVSVCPDAQGRLWVSGGNEDLYIFEREKFERVVPIVHGVKVILADRGGRIWAGTRDGLYMWDGHDPRQFKLLDGLGQSGVRALAEDREGRIWCGGGDGNLYSVAGNNIEAFRPADSPETYAIWSLLVEPNGTVWAGTFRGGLLRFKGQKFTRYNKAQGLPDNIISQILGDGAGNLWLGSHQGIFRVEKSQLNDVADGRRDQLVCLVFGRADGLLSLDCSGGYQPAAWRTSDNRLCFATAKGVVSVRSRDVTPNPLPPKIVIEKVLVEGVQQWPRLPDRPAGANGTAEPSAVREISGPQTNGTVAYLEIPPGQVQLEFQYAGLSLVSPERVQYRYQLEGADHDWVAAGTRRIAHYGALPSGTYRFRVTACNSDGVWAESPVSLKIKILPHFYETWCFQGLAFCSAMGLVFGGVRYRFNLKLRRKTEEMDRRHALERERARIARDIHDDLGSSLTLIAVMGDLADQDKDGDRVKKMSVTARQAIKSLDEIVWAVNPRNDKLVQLIDYICGYAVDYLNAAHIRCRMDVPEQMPAHDLSSNIRYNIFLVVKEALQNVVKHSGANEVRLCVSITPAGLEMVISDNGRGFGMAPDDALADGLRNMRQRMNDIGGGFEIHSEAGAGTAVTLNFPLPPGGQPPQMFI